MDFEIVFSSLDFVDDMLPIRCQHIPVRPLQSLCDILKSLIELGCSGDVSALRDLTCSSKMSSTGAWIVRKWRRLDLCRHLLRWSALRWWTILLIRIHYCSALDCLVGQVAIEGFGGFGCCLVSLDGDGVIGWV